MKTFTKGISVKTKKIQFLRKELIMKIEMPFVIYKVETFFHLLKEL